MPQLIHYFILLAFCLFSLESSAAVLVKAKMWPKNATLNVVFVDGTPLQKQRVMQYAPIWTKNTSLKLSFYDNFKSAPTLSHIRISFQAHTGSILGNHGNLNSKSPTLQLAELNHIDLSSERAKRLILHEFGHALGFEHEYRNPKWPFSQRPIQQQIKACEPKMQAIGHTTLEAQNKCKEINSTLNATLIFSTVYDEFSIMNYPLTIDLQNNQQKTIHAKSQLSILDKLAMERWYGK
ncbi:hypothetical protein [Aliikangiella sp. IMCC44359]|uniref:hypothetical protein n=1 Tax=Aliikangiella sp. IMCC44359 TaxID=3459125 RepID=UPI00403B2C70